MKGIAVLGSTGTIGEATLDVAGRHPDRFRVVALAANANHEALFAQCVRFRPDYAALADRGAAAKLAQRIASAGIPTRVIAGPDALTSIATLPEADAVMAAIVGAAGLASTLAAAAAGKQVLLANKEALVIAGPLLLEAANRSGAVILPIDSEHNAIFQCLPAGGEPGKRPAGVARIVLTASGGPFLRTRREELSSVTPEQAVAHPNWRMGPKISVDSATLMNKGLELIEACHSVRRPALGRRCRHPSTEHRSFAGRVRRRLGASADEPARHAGPDRPRARLARPNRLGSAQPRPREDREIIF